MTETNPPATVPPVKRSYMRTIALRFLTHCLPVIGTVMVVLLWASALFADVIAPHDPMLLDTSKRFMPPFTSWTYPLGTDDLGRDTLSRLL
jgi:peptide/nickel transport system permease protein